MTYTDIMLNVTNINVRGLDDDLWQRFRVAAVSLKVSLKAALAEAIAEWLAKRGF